MVHMTTSEARSDFSAAIRSAQSGERVILSSHGKAVAALVSVGDLELLQEIEDRIDGRHASGALAEAEREGTVPWDQVKADFGL